jgi:hypothetical protein
LQIQNGNHSNHSWRIAELAIALLIPIGICAVWAVSSGRLYSLAHEILGRQICDQLSFIWIFDRLSENILTRPFHLFDGKALFPSTSSLALSEPVLLSSLFYRAWFALTGDRLLGYHLALGSFLVLNFVSMYFFCRSFLKIPGSILASLIFTFSPIRLGHIRHAHMFPQFLFPLVAFCLVRYEQTHKKIFLSGAGILAALQFYFSMAFGLVLIVSLSPYFLFKWFRRRESEVSYWGECLRFCVPFGVLTFPLGARYLIEVLSFKGKGISVASAKEFSATLVSFLTPPVGHGYERFITRYVSLSLGTREETSLFIGFVVMGLALAGAYAALRQKNKRNEFWTVVVGVTLAFSILFSMGPAGVLYRIYFVVFPGVQMIRTPARLAFTYLFLIAIVAGLGWEFLQRRLGKSILFWPIGALLCFLIWEDHRINLPFTPVDSARNGATQFLSHTKDRDPVLYLPLGLGVADAAFMYESLEHDHPIVNGYVRFVPRKVFPINDLVSAPGPRLDQFIARVSKPLHDLGLRYLVVERSAYPQWSDSKNRGAAYSDTQVLIFDLEKNLKTLDFDRLGTGQKKIILETGLVVSRGFSRGQIDHLSTRLR